MNKFLFLILSTLIFIYACVSGNLKPKDVCIDFAAAQDGGDGGDSSDFAKQK